jgi:hypothetical protein
MKKHQILLPLLLITIGTIHGQNTDQSVISTSGGDVTVGSTQLSWTIGQTVAASTTSNSIFLTEGFHQSEVIEIALGASPEEQIITIYPNPTVDYVSLQASENRGFGTYQIVSIKGEILIGNQKANFSEENKINMVDFIDGVYLLLISIDDQPMRQFKIIKN